MINSRLIKYRASFIIVFKKRAMLMDITRDEAAKIAASHFRDGYNCAESVLMAMQEVGHMEKRPDIATAFGAGIGRRGSVCGAVTGGIIAINLKYGRMKAEEDKEKSYALALNFYKKFEKEFKSAICYELIECDLTTLHGQKVFKESNLFEKKCVRFVEGAVKILIGLTNEA